MAFNFTYQVGDLNTNARDSSLRIGVVIRDRSKMVTSLMDAIDDISPSGAKFIKSLDYKRTTYGSSGILGEPLYDLTEKQVSFMNSLHEQYVIDKRNYQAEKPRM